MDCAVIPKHTLESALLYRSLEFSVKVFVRTNLSRRRLLIELSSTIAADNLIDRKKNDNLIIESIINDSLSHSYRCPCRAES